MLRHGFQEVGRVISDHARRVVELIAQRADLGQGEGAHLGDFADVLGCQPPARDVVKLARLDLENAKELLVSAHHKVPVG